MFLASLLLDLCPSHGTFICISQENPLPMPTSIPILQHLHVSYLNVYPGYRQRLGVLINK